VVLPVYILGIEFDNFGESLKKLRLDRADGDIKPVGGLVGVVPGSAAVENIVAALGAPDAAGAQGTEHRHQRSDAIDHGGVDHIALASGASVEQAGEHADRQIKRPAGVIADEIE